MKAGEYRFLIDGNHLTIQNGKKVVAESEGRWEDRDKKSEYTEILSKLGRQGSGTSLCRAKERIRSGSVKGDSNQP